MHWPETKLKKCFKTLCDTCLYKPFLCVQCLTNVRLWFWWSSVFLFIWLMNTKYLIRKKNCEKLLFSLCIFISILNNLVCLIFINRFTSTPYGFWHNKQNEQNKSFYCISHKRSFEVDSTLTSRKTSHFSNLKCLYLSYIALLK